MLHLGYLLVINVGVDYLIALQHSPQIWDIYSVSSTGRSGGGGGGGTLQLRPPPPKKS